jgi:S-adenosylmethionine:tRNA ribosyltransferase-isomerase
VLTAGHGVTVAVVDRLPGGRFLVRPTADGPLEDALEAAGEVPLPPYVTVPLPDPSATRRSTPASPARRRRRRPACTSRPTCWPPWSGAARSWGWSLRIGLDTFRPVEVAELDDHPMHSEAYRIDPAVRALVVGCPWRGTTRAGRRDDGGAVLETIADPGGAGQRTHDAEDPAGHRFRVVDALITNFHLPRSTLLALVMAFAGVEETRRLYREAIRDGYRFYSFGDAMLVV